MGALLLVIARPIDAQSAYFKTSFCLTTVLLRIAIITAPDRARHQRSWASSATNCLSRLRTLWYTDQCRSLLVEVDAGWSSGNRNSPPPVEESRNLFRGKHTLFSCYTPEPLPSGELPRIVLKDKWGKFIHPLNAEAFAHNLLHAVGRGRRFRSTGSVAYRFAVRPAGCALLALVAGVSRQSVTG